MANAVSTLTRAATQKRVWIPAAALGIALLSFAAGLIAAAFVRNGIGNEQFWKIAAQPTATVGAGLLAIGAATIALTGVLLTQRTNVRTTKAQLRQQRAAMIRQEKQHAAQLELQRKATEEQRNLHAEQLAASADLEREKHDRQVMYQARMAACSALIALTTASTAVQRAIDNDVADYLVNNPRGARDAAPRTRTDDAVRACSEARDACSTTAAGLLILGDVTAYETIMAFTNAVGRWLLSDSVRNMGTISELQVWEHGIVRTIAIGALSKETLEKVAAKS